LLSLSVLAEQEWRPVTGTVIAKKLIAGRSADHLIDLCEILHSILLLSSHRLGPKKTKKSLSQNNPFAN
jgi:hypothetical protein